MANSALDVISLAFEHTKQQLFKPLRLGQWTRLALVGLLAGELGSSGGCNIPSSFRQPGGSPGHFPPNFPHIDFGIWMGVIAVLAIVFFVFVVVMMYVSSVMRFVLFDSILMKECRIRQGWGRRQGAGLKLFWWHILYGLASFAGFVVLIGIPAVIGFALGWFTRPKEHLAPLILGGIFLFLVFVLLVIVSAVVIVFTKDFVVPQMALENISAMEGWRRLWPMITAEKGGFFLYAVMKIVMTIGAGIVVGIATVILGLVIAVPTIALGAIAVITGHTAGLSWNAYTITLAIVVGSVVCALFFYVISLISVPVIVFFPAYSIYFFAGRYRALGALIYPAPAVVAPGLTAVPGGLPPLPSGPEPVG